MDDLRCFRLWTIIGALQVTGFLLGAAVIGGALGLLVIALVEALSLVLWATYPTSTSS